MLYARISTTEKRQSYRAQLQELRQVAKRRGWKVAAEYHDIISGKKVDERRGLAAAMALCRSGRVEIFAAVDVDRVARSTLHFLNLLAQLDAMGVRMACVRDPHFDTTTPEGRYSVQLRAAHAELEAKIIGRRVRESLAIKKANGVKLGAPRRYDYSRLGSVLRLRARKKPLGWRAIAAEFGGTPGGWERAVARATGRAA